MKANFSLINSINLTHGFVCYKGKTGTGRVVGGLILFPRGEMNLNLPPYFRVFTGTTSH